MRPTGRSKVGSAERSGERISLSQPLFLRVELCFGGGSFSDRNLVVQQVKALHQSWSFMRWNSSKKLFYFYAAFLYDRFTNMLLFGK